MISNMLPTAAKTILATKVKALVEASELTREEIARRAGVGDGTLGYIMYGNGNPTIDNIEKVARFFRRSAADLLSHEEATAGEPLIAQENLALYNEDPRINRLIALFHRLPTADQEELLEEMSARATKYEGIIAELTERKSSAVHAFKPTISDGDTEKKLNLPKKGKRS